MYCVRGSLFSWPRFNPDLHPSSVGLGTWHIMCRIKGISSASTYTNPCISGRHLVMGHMWATNGREWISTQSGYKALERSPNHLGKTRWRRVFCCWDIWFSGNKKETHATKCSIDLALSVSKTFWHYSGFMMIHGYGLAAQMTDSGTIILLPPKQIDTRCVLK